MKKEADSTINKLIPISHDQAVNHIQSIFPDCVCKFDENCIESFGHMIEEKKIIHTYVWYNKICVEYDGKLIYWPIQPYKLIDPQGRECSYFDIFKSY